MIKFNFQAVLLRKESIWNIRARQRFLLL